MDLNQTSAFLDRFAERQYNVTAGSHTCCRISWTERRYRRRCRVRYRCKVVGRRTRIAVPCGILYRAGSQRHEVMRPQSKISRRIDRQGTSRYRQVRACGSIIARH